MGINSINSNNYTAHNTKQVYTKSAANTEKQPSAPADEAVSVRISNEALEKLTAHKHGTGGYAELTDASIKAALPSREEVSARKAAPVVQENVREIEATYTFGAETLAHFVDSQLSGKLEKSNQIANQMETMIRSAVYNKDATVEERAIDRESALKLAEHIANNYFENPEEAKSFMDKINKFAENDILREKGYILVDNSDAAPFKSYTMPTAPSDYVRIDSGAMREIMGSDRTQTEKEDALSKLREDVVKRFDENEKSVGETINNVKTAMSGIVVDNSFGSNMEKLFSAISPTQAGKWDRIIGLLNP